MGAVLDAGLVRRLRLRAQGLAAEDGAATGGVEEVVRHLVGVQAQEAEGAALAIAIRHRGLSAAQVEAARLEARSIVRTWALRGTLHLVATADLGWLLPLLAPGVIRGRRRRYAQLDLSQERYGRGLEVLKRALQQQGAMTRAELGQYLAGQGEPLEGQALYHALGRAGLEGVLCYGPDREGEETYVLLDEWVSPGPALAEEGSLAELARRYVLGYGPAGPEDFAAWSGLPLRRARAAFASLESEMVAVEIEGSGAWLHASRRHWLEASALPESMVRFLPAYDPYLLGYRSRGHVVSAEHARRIHPGGGFLRPTVVLDGWAVGTWKAARKSGGRGGLEITVDLFDLPGAWLQKALEDEVEVLSRFYGEQVRLKIAEKI
jgi:hypothetical protein